MNTKSFQFKTTEDTGCITVDRVTPSGVWCEVIHKGCSYPKVWISSKNFMELVTGVVFKVDFDEQGATTFLNCYVLQRSATRERRPRP